MTERAPSYLASPRAVSIHATFVANVSRVMRERGWVHAANPETWKQHSPAQMARVASLPRLNLDRLSEASGIPKRTVENIMREDNQPTMVGAAAIAQALGVPLDELCGMGRDWGMGPGGEPLPRADGLEGGATTPPVLECIHVRRWLPGRRFCARCHTAWSTFQSRKRELYEANRRAATAAADTRETERRASVTAQGMDPDDVKR